MSEWCVREPVCGKAVVVDALSPAAAARAGIDALIEDYPDLMSCRECERHSVGAVHVYPLDGLETFVYEEQPRLTRVAAPGQPGV